MEQRLGQLFSERRILVSHPVVGPARCGAADGESGRHLERNLEPPRAAREIVRGVAALQRDRRQRLAAGDLEYRAQQDGTPGDGAAVFRRQFVDLRGGEIAVRGGEIEVEIDRVCHVVVPKCVNRDS